MFRADFVYLKCFMVCWVLYFEYLWAGIFPGTILIITILKNVVSYPVR